MQVSSRLGATLLYLLTAVVVPVVAQVSPAKPDEPHVVVAARLQSFSPNLYAAVSNARSAPTLDVLAAEPGRQIAVDQLPQENQANDAASMNALAIAYARGTASLPRDILKARAWAEKSAQLGDKDGQYLFYQTVLQGPEWNYRDAEGKTDEKKYQELADRPMHERGLDQDAYNMLARSAEQGHSDALASVIATLLVKTAPGASRRALELIERAPPAVVQKFEPVKKSLQLVVGNFGQTYTSLNTFKNAINTVYLMARIKAGLQDNSSCSLRKGFLLSKITLTRPLADAEYLPVDGILKDFYLIKGNWQESWDVDVCGKVVTVPIEFQADGLGGANYQAASN